SSRRCHMRAYPSCALPLAASPPPLFRPRCRASHYPGGRMPTLVVIGYENEIKAEEVRLALLKLQREYLIDLGDAVVAVHEQNGNVKLRQLVNTTAAGALSGGFWGTLIGVLFMNPLVGLAVGTAAGAASGAL